MTSFSSITTGTKRECVSGLSETEDAVCKDKVELTSLPIGIVFAFGNFYVENNTIKGIAKFIFAIVFIPIPVPVIDKDTEVYIPLDWFIFLVRGNHLLIYISTG